MQTITFRDLRPEEIEVRVGNTFKDNAGNVVGFNLMLYKTARVDANILDDTFGLFNWQKKYYQVKNTMVCSIGLYNEERKEWIWKDDGGDDDTTMEQVKAELSDSFKRAGFAIGIGRKLYSASKIYMRVEKTQSNTERAYYQVSEIEYDETSITKLVIINKKTKEQVITYGTQKKTSTEAKKVLSDFAPKTPISAENKSTIVKYLGGLDMDKYNAFIQRLKDRFGVGVISELTNEQAEIIVKGITNGK